MRISDWSSDVCSSDLGTGLSAQTTGSVPQGLDSQESGDRALAIVGIATIVLIVGLLAIIFRSVIICLLPVVVVTLASMGLRRASGWGRLCQVGWIGGVAVSLKKT